MSSVPTSTRVPRNSRKWSCIKVSPPQSDQCIVEYLKEYENRWENETRGRPSHEDGLGILKILIKLMSSGGCLPLSAEHFADAQCFFPSNSLEDVIHRAVQDRWQSHTHPDKDRGPQVASEFTKPHTSATVETCMFYGSSQPLDPQDPYAALLDFASSEKHLGKVEFRMPQDDFVTCDSINKCTRHDIELGGTFTPAGWVSHPHSDYYSGRSPIVHLEGTKLWYFFMRTPHNAKIMDQTLLIRDREDDFVPSILSQVEGLYWAILDSPVGFVMDRFEYHGCLSLTSSLHLGGPAWYPADLLDSVYQIDLIINNMQEFVMLADTPDAKQTAWADLMKYKNNFRDALDNALRAAELILNGEKEEAVEAIHRLQKRIEHLSREKETVMGGSCD